MVFTIVAWIEYKGAILSGFDELTLIPTRDVLYPPHSAGDNEKRLASIISVKDMRCYLTTWFPKFIWGAILFTAFRHFLETFYIMAQTNCVGDAVCVCINGSDCPFYTPLNSYNCKTYSDVNDFCQDAYFRGDTDKKNLDFGGVSFLVLFIINVLLFLPYMYVYFEINALVWKYFSRNNDENLSTSEANNPMTRV